MAEIKLRFDISFSRRLVVWSGAAAMMLLAVPELESESVTLSTYYPAPSGVYTQMITTGNTYLSRDGGNTGVGTTAPVAKMHILGSSQNTLSLDSPAYPELTFRTGGTVTTPGPIRAYNAIATSADGYFSAGVPAAHAAVNDWIFRNEGGGSIKWGHSSIADMQLDQSGNLRLFGTVANSGNIDAGGMIISRQGGLTCDQPQQYSYAAPSGGTANLCGGRYITTISGFYTKYMAIQIDRGSLQQNPVNNAFIYICCDCPVGGCVL